MLTGNVRGQGGLRPRRLADVVWCKPAAAYGNFPKQASAVITCDTDFASFRQRDVLGFNPASCYPIGQQIDHTILKGEFVFELDQHRTAPFSAGSATEAPKVFSCFNGLPKSTKVHFKGIAVGDGLLGREQEPGITVQIKGTNSVVNTSTRRILANHTVFWDWPETNGVIGDPNTTPKVQFRRGSPTKFLCSLTSLPTRSQANLARTAMVSLAEDLVPARGRADRQRRGKAWLERNGDRILGLTFAEGVAHPLHKLVDTMVQHWGGADELPEIPANAVVELWDECDAIRAAMEARVIGRALQTAGPGQPFDIIL